MEHPKDIGDRSALAIAIALQGIGHAVYLPFGENTRADFVIDDGTRLARVQCKTGRLRNGVVQFKTCSSYAHHSSPAAVARDYLGQIEYFAVYCPETSGIYLIPIEEVPLGGMGRSESAKLETVRGCGSDMPGITRLDA
ncbi:MAG: group I intron-associated PD-(D/E)XK endonuclease [Actinomycetota bacterium]|nr:group I intron-associated PD-(D/E)XK endonuclease [Actinomycetota bacterium]